VALAPVLYPRRFIGVFFSIPSFSPSKPRLIAKTAICGYLPLQEKVLERYEKQENFLGCPPHLGRYEAFFAKRSPTTLNTRWRWPCKIRSASSCTLYFRIPRVEERKSFIRSSSVGCVPSDEDYITFGRITCFAG